MWPEINKVKSENRHEILLCGCEISKRIKEKGLDLILFELTSLNYLNIHDTCLNEIPSEIGNLTNLQTLVLHSNQLEHITDAVFNLDKLKLLDLSGNRLENIPELFEKLQNLVSLNISNNCLKEIPRIANSKLTVLDISKNQLKHFTMICCAENSNLSEIKLNDNEINIIPTNISDLSSLKVLEMNNNKIKEIPHELIECGKLKVFSLKDNPISDRRLLKLIDQCRTKQILDYIRQHAPKTNNKKKTHSENSNNSEQQNDDGEKKLKFSIIVNSYNKNDEIFRVVITEDVNSVRQHFIGCIVKDLHFDNENFKKFLLIQNKLHDTICSKRIQSTIATHDLKKLPQGHLTYTALPPNKLSLKPLNHAKLMTGFELFIKLQREADNIRKEKKRNNCSGIHKYLSLIEGKPLYPCVLNSNNEVISFPPITNSDISKIDLETNSIFIEVTSSVSQQLCKITMEALLKEMVYLFGNSLSLFQVKTTDTKGILKCVYPGRNDLNYENNENIQIIRN